ncbi:MAG: hypothetical protein PHI59_00595 [Candidatus Omnitrophica bacterium]|nr:hypothetical protein [Candidatus Omnitrophota bacterium]
MIRKTIIAGMTTCLLTCSYIAFAMDITTSMGDNFDISFPSKGQGYVVWPSGIIKIVNNNFLMYIRPANRIYKSVDEYFIFWQYKKQIFNDKLIISERYYPENTSLRPNYFYIEVVIVPKKEGFTFNPMQIYVDKDDKRYASVRYIWPEGELDNIYPFSEELFFLNEDERSADKERFDQIDIQLLTKEKTGFAVRFDVLMPMPGDRFGIKIEGLKYHNEQVEIPTLIYDKKKIFERGRF